MLLMKNACIQIYKNQFNNCDIFCDNGHKLILVNGTIELDSISNYKLVNVRPNIFSTCMVYGGNIYSE